MTVTVKSKQTISTSQDDLTAITCGASSVLFWSVGAYFFCLLNHLPGLQVLTIIQLVGGFCGLVFERRPLRFEAIINRARYGWPFLLLLMINQFSYTWAFRLADAAQVDLLNYLWPTLVVVIEAFYRKDRLSKKQYIGMLLCFLGIVVLMLPELRGVSDITILNVCGYFLGLSAAISWSFYTVVSRYKAKKGSYSIAEDVIILGFCNLLLQMLFGSWQSTSFQDSYVLFFLALCYYGLAFPFWKKGLASGSYQIVGGFANAVPLLSVVWLIIGGISEITTTLFIACIFVTIGCIWIGKKENE